MVLAGRLSEEKQPLISNMESIPSSVISAVDSLKGKRPQAIAHRGYKSCFPENTIAAFHGAVQVGAHALETDTHLTKDGVVVLSHDPTLNRCFGRNDKIIDLNWSEIESLRTLRAPHEPMPRLRDLLDFLTNPGLEDIWVLLDIKLDNDPDDMIRSIASTLASVVPSNPWCHRVLLGFWDASYLPFCSRYLPGHPTAHIGFSISYARKFLKEPGVGFNMKQKAMVGRCGKKFLADIKTSGRSIFLWTVNDEESMKWSIMKDVDGVITDDPKKYLQVARDYDGKRFQPSIKQWGPAFCVDFFATFAGFIFRSLYKRKRTGWAGKRGGDKNSG